MDAGSERDELPDLDIVYYFRSSSWKSHTESEQFGIDYALVAMFIGLLVLTLDSMVKNERLTVVLTVLFSTMLIYYLVGIVTSSYVAVLIATLIGALIGAVMSTPKETRKTEVI